MTSVAVPALRHPLLLAKALVALDLLSEGRVVAGIGPGSSSADYDAVGLDFAERWQRLDEAARLLRHVLRGAPMTGATRALSGAAGSALPRAVPCRRACPCGSGAGGRRPACVGWLRHGDGWLASAYNTDAGSVRRRTGPAPGRNCPSAVVTMWTWVTEDDEDARRQVDDVLAPLLGRDPDAAA